MELLSDWHSPWALPPDCSPQDQHLREMAVLAPELVRGSRIFQVLRSLRIVGKGVSAASGALVHPSPVQETVSSCQEGKHPGKRIPSPSQGLPRCHYCSWGRAAGSPTQRVALICVTHMSHGSTLHVHITFATRWLRDMLAKPISLQVEEVDNGLLQLQQLEELILSANQISSITSANLPRTLKVSEQCLATAGRGRRSHLGTQHEPNNSKEWQQWLIAKGVCCSLCPRQVLELCCNAVADLQDLCTQPPPELQHLGLGYNRLCGPSQHKYLTADFW